jgi:3-dehydroshikimate dehydratase
MKDDLFPLTGFADEIHADLEIQLDTLARLNLQGLDLRTAYGKNVLLLDDDEVDEIGRQVALRGLRVQSIGSPVNKVRYQPERQAEELGKLRRAAEIARRLGTRRIRIFSPQTDEDGRSDAWPLVKEWMAEQVELAKEHDVVLLHENDGRFFGAYPANAKLLFDELGGPRFRAIFDFANTVLLGYRPMRDWFPWLLPHLDTIHVKDAIEVERRVVPAGEGDGELRETMSFLLANGWSGTLTLEPHAKIAAPEWGFSGEEAFERAVAALRGVLDEVGATA